MKKKIIVFLLALIVLVGLVPVQANTNPALKLWVDGSYVETDVAPFIEDGRTLVPVRFVAEALGYEVSWDNDTQTVTIKDSSTEINMIINNKIALHNGEKTILNKEPMLKDGRTFVPIRDVAERFGKEVNWDGDNWTVIIGAGYIAPASSETIGEDNKTPVKNTNGGGNNQGGWKETSNPAYLYAEGRLIGNKNSNIYHSPGQQGYEKVAYKNAVFFDTAQEAINAGYRAAKR